MLQSPAQPDAMVRAQARSRRVRTLALAGSTLLACVVGAVCVNMLAGRFRARVDLTSGASQRLAPRTQRLLERASPGYRIVIAADMRGADPRARDTLGDVLREFEASGRDLRALRIDTGSQDGARQFHELVRELTQRERTAIDKSRTTVQDALTGAASIERTIVNELTPSLASLRDFLPADSEDARGVRTFCEQGAAALRVRAGDIEAARKDASERLASIVGDVPLPAPDKAADALVRVLEGVTRDMTSVARQMERVSALNGASAQSVQGARQISAQAASLRDQASLLVERLRVVPRLEVSRVADALRASQAAIIMGPSGKGLAAMDLSTLLPGGAWIDAAQAGSADLRRRVEEVLGTSIASVENPVRPILVLTHAEQRAFLIESRFVDALLSRMSARGVDCVEWCVGQSEQADLSGVPDAAKRPRVYLTLSPNDAAPAPAQGAPTGAQRAARLAQALGALIDEKERVIVSLGPSILPTYGQRDPTSVLLDRFGIDARTGTPLLSEALTQRGRSAETDRIVQGPGGEHVLAGAMRGLPTYVTWAIPLEASANKPAETVRITPLLTVAPGPGTWGESEWQRLREVRREERHLLPDPPVFNETRDMRSPQRPLEGAGGAWTIAAAVEQRNGPRAVIVGSNDWYIDQVTQQAVMVDGRPSFQNPGNMELLEASIMWLCGQDDLIAQSPTSRAVGVVRAIPDAQLRMVRLAIIFGLPASVLLLGGAWRLSRRNARG